MSHEPEIKKIKTESAIITLTPSCKHFVKRKKRYCKMTVAKGQEYCGEHMPPAQEKNENNDDTSEKKDRIPCPLDPKHTVYAKNLHKHLKICNAKVKNLPDYILPGLNIGSDESLNDYSSIKLSDIESSVIENIISKINILYARDIHGIIEELILEHPVLKDEIANPEYGHETLKHLIQTSSLLGCLAHHDFLNDSTSFIEFGAGKGQVSYWLAQAICQFTESNVLLIDKASHRHKKDNKIIDRDSVLRVRADIADLDIKNLENIKKSKQIIGVSKHLCGGATDLTLRCILNGNCGSVKTKGFVIALCCHHRCTWKPFVGKKYFLENELNEREFAIITKMVGWAICGSGLSRERRREIEAQGKSLNEVVEAETNNKIKLSLDERQAIGMKCKRIIDFARLLYLMENGYKTSLKYYVKSSVTLENVCLVCKLIE